MASGRGENFSLFLIFFGVFLCFFVLRFWCLVFGVFRSNILSFFYRDFFWHIESVKKNIMYMSLRATRKDGNYDE